MMQKKHKHRFQFVRTYTEEVITREDDYIDIPMAMFICECGVRKNVRVKSK